MTTIHVLYGTESGNAEMVADDVAATLGERGFATEIAELSDVTPADLADYERVVVVTSTYGEGGLPEGAAPFHEALLAERPDLSGLEFAAYGLGDSTYETFNNAVDTLRGALIELGARQLGETGKHDAASATDPAAEATAWVLQLTDLVPA